jgi:hypothetical protein
MEKSTEMSLRNHTGLQMSPIHARELLAAQKEFQPENQDTEAADLMRRQYIAEGDTLGTVPPPATAKGMAKTGMQAMTGLRPQVLVDKLGERLAFERSGTRLYDAMLRKCEGAGLPPGVTLEQLAHIRDEEAGHAELLAQAIEMLGADPTVQTPDAVATGVEGMGLMQAVNDPRTTPVQCLHTLLIAELADTASWELLIQLAEHCQQVELATRFRNALDAELRHAALVSDWYRSAVLQDVQLAATRH